MPVAPIQKSGLVPKMDMSKLQKDVACLKSGLLGTLPDMVGLGMPYVYVSSVILESATGIGLGPQKELVVDEDPHIDYTGIEPIFPNINQFKDAAKNNNLTALAGYTASLHVTLNLVFKDIVSEGEIPWFLDDDFVNSYKIKFVQTTNPIATSVLLDKYVYSEAPKLFDPESPIEGYTTKEMSLKELIGGTPEDWATVDPKKITTSTVEEGILHQITATKGFPVATHDPDHLAFFLIPFLDINEFTSGTPLGLKVSYPEAAPHSNLLGKPLGEIVIENGSVKKSGTIFRDTDDKVYNGPKHWEPPKGPSRKGIWKKGESGSDQNFYYWSGTEYIPHPPGNVVLKAFKVTNLKVQDFRLLNKIDKIDLNFSPIEAGTSNTFSPGQVGNTTFPGLKEPLFSDLKLSRDSIGRARYFFGMDWDRVVRKISAFPNLYNFAEPAMVDLFVANSTIQSMKIKRRRIEEVRCENQLLDSCSDYKDFEDVDELVETIAAGKEQQTDIKTKNQFIGTSNYLNLKGKKMGSLFETEIAISDTAGFGNIRHFAGIDESIKEITDGIYQYKIELIVTDGAYIMLRKLTHEARYAIRDLQKYLDASYRGLNIDPHTNAFSNSFKFGNGVSTVSGEAAQYEGAIYKGLVSLQNMLRLTVRKPSVEEMLTALTIATSPETGSPAGIESMIRILRTLRDKIIKMLESTSTTKRYKSTGNDLAHPKTAPSTDSHLRNIEMEYYFSNVFDADVDKNAGYEFLSPQNKIFHHEASALSTNGLLTLTKLQFRARTAAELLKIFNDNAVKNSPISPLRIPQAETDTLENARYRFLAPSQILLPNMRKPFENISYGKRMWSRQKYQKLVSDIIVYNRYGRSTNDQDLSTSRYVKSITEEQQRIRRKLSEVFFSRSCTVERTMTANDALMLQGNNINSSFTDQAVRRPPEYAALFGADTDNLNIEGSMPTPDDILPESYEDPTSTSVAYENPNSLLLTLMNVKNFNTDREEVSEEWYNLGKMESVLTSWFWAGKGPEKIKSSPNHIKFWFIKNTPGSQTSLLRPDFPTPAISAVAKPPDLMRTQGLYPTIWANFKNLVEIQVFLGYGGNISGSNTPFLLGTTLLGGSLTFSPSLKEEKWAPLTPNRIKSPGNYLCRMVPYEDMAYNLKKVKDLQLPIYHEYFIIKAGQDIHSESNTGFGIASKPTLKPLSSEKVNTVLKNFKGVVSQLIASPTGTEHIQTAQIGHTPGADRAKRKFFGVMQNQLKKYVTVPLSQVGKRQYEATRKGLQKLLNRRNN